MLSKHALIALVDGSCVVLFGGSKAAVGHGSARVKFVWREAFSLEIQIYCVYREVETR